MPRLFPFTRCGVHDSAGHLNAYMAGLVGGKQTSKQSLLGQLPALLCTDCGILTAVGTTNRVGGSSGESRKWCVRAA
jgi:hypothetical protein